MTAYAHNTARASDGVTPVVVEDGERFPWFPGERESEWHEATDAECIAYRDYWDAITDAEDSA